MEDNNQNKQQKNGLNASVVLSFVVAIFAIVSIAMGGISLLQNTGVSYAAPDAESFKFNMYKPTAASTGMFVTGYGSDSKTFQIPIYVANNNENDLLFCVEKTADVADNEDYTPSDDITDNGLLYILNNSTANGVYLVEMRNQNIKGTTNEVRSDNAKYTNAWITQAAIWLYLYETDSTATAPTSKNYISPEDLATIKSATLLKQFDPNVTIEDIYSSTTTLYADYIKPLVDKAKSAGAPIKLNVSKASDEVSLSENKKFYRSALITVTGDPSSSLMNYKISLSGIDGAKAIDEDGNELTTNIPAGTKFYVTIPAEKVTKEIQKVQVKVDGSFQVLQGKYFNAASGNKQRVVTVREIDKIVSDGTEIEFIGTDDTGMNTFQTIYFIGLIVLLCGVGIVYANAKPVQVKQ